MAKRRANHVISGMNATKAQGQGVGYNEEISNEPLTAEQRQFNKKRKTNQ
ncbi:small acid-soluble spore protein O [Bacillus sp. NTK074B]|nr:small acid-soluble spore protein O [Bacillus sp. NTK074B]